MFVRLKLYEESEGVSRRLGKVEYEDHDVEEFFLRQDSNERGLAGPKIWEGRCGSCKEEAKWKYLCNKEGG